MATEVFIDRRPKSTTMLAIEQANEIIAEYLPQGHTLTLRQLYYQFVARGLLSENSLKEYKRIGVAVTIGRDVGMIDWDAIEDRSRFVIKPQTWASPAERLQSAAKSYREDLWAGQRIRPEVWIEKDALVGVIEGVCEEHRVPCFATRGNGSQSALYEAGRRFARQQGLLIPVVIHLADHDPCGVFMTRDLERRLALYAGGGVQVRRVALTMEQVRRYRPPPNFSKEADPNLPKYVRQFRTNKCWELDALSPATIADIVRDELAGMIDQRSWRKAEAAERSGRRRLAAIAENAER
jgi:hypothetical protein